MMKIDQRSNKIMDMAQRTGHIYNKAPRCSKCHFVLKQCMADFHFLKMDDLIFKRAMQVVKIHFS